MARYINADALIHEYYKNPTYLNLCTAINNAPTADVVEIKKDGEWEMFDLISSAYYGKVMYLKEDNLTVYSRYSHHYMIVDDAIREFISLIGGTGM